MNTQNHQYVFFGSATFSIYALDELEKAGMPPALVVTTPDKPVGRGLTMTPTEVKVWAQKRNISVLDPAKLDSAFSEELKKNKNLFKDLFFVVAAYGKIIPQAILDIPSKGTLNIHPSLLPHYRGAAPIQSAILDDVKQTGVTIMRIDALMDHGPIVAQKTIPVSEWPAYEVIEETLGREGGRLLANTIPEWLAGKITEKAQDHAAATFTKKITKENGLIDIADITSDSPKVQYEIFRKIQAYHQWPSVYFFTKLATGAKSLRVKITKAAWRDNHLVIEKVIPEGKKEIDYEIFKH